ncbi:MAG: Crp/Fnr family transcriptional regulator, partial [Nitrospira sp.]|nr:Crp/Fnr family transcriptional regulator [Nitrospira sp.]
MEPIIHHFHKYLPLTEAEHELILSRIKHRQIKRRQMILQEGLVCHHYTFIVKGCFKMYGVDDRGIEHNIQFAAEDDWIADIGSFHSKKPSGFFIEAVEPSEIIQIEQQDLYFLYINIPKLDR